MNIDLTWKYTCTEATNGGLVDTRLHLSRKHRSMTKNILGVILIFRRSHLNDDGEEWVKRWCVLSNLQEELTLPFPGLDQRYYM